MRFADGPTTEAEVVVHAPPDRIWALVADIDLPARFSQEFLGATWLDGGPAVGARFTGRNHHSMIGTWETTCVVTRYEPERAFEWAVGSADEPGASWRFELEPLDDGVRLRQWCRLGPGPSGLTPALERMPDKEERIIERRLGEHRANMQLTLDGIKQLAEDPS